MSAPRACRTQPSIDEGPPAGSLWPVTNTSVIVCASPFGRHPLPAATVSGLSLQLEWCSRSVELAAIQRMSVEVAARRDEFKLRIKTWARRQ